MDRYIVTEEDARIGYIRPVQTRCPKCGKIDVDFPTAPLGRVLKCDIGKMCRKIKGNWYVENVEQFEKRTGKSVKV